MFHLSEYPNEDACVRRMLGAHAAARSHGRKLEVTRSETRAVTESDRADFPQNVPTSVPSDAQTWHHPTANAYISVHGMDSADESHSAWRAARTIHHSARGLDESGRLTNLLVTGTIRVLPVSRGISSVVVTSINRNLLLLCLSAPLRDRLDQENGHDSGRNAGGRVSELNPPTLPYVGSSMLLRHGIYVLRSCRAVQDARAPSCR